MDAADLQPRENRPDLRPIPVDEGVGVLSPPPNH